MRFDILTLFPILFFSYLQDSILKRAIEKGFIRIYFHNIRDFSKNKHKQVDDTPYGGGHGMVIMCQPVFDCIESVKKQNKGPVIYLTPQGKIFTQNKAERLSTVKEIILLCGRYEGIDQRICDSIIDEEISIGNYVLTGGELPAMVLVDATSRLIPGVLGKNESMEEDSFSKKLNRKKEYPSYTKPANFRSLKVPKVLLSGNHKEIEKWRMKHLQ